MREVFGMLGVARCVVAHSMTEVQGLSYIPQDVAILDINLGRDAPSGIDVCHWLRGNDFRGRTVFLTGHAQSSPLVRKALELPNTTLLTKPVSVERLASILP
jgi:CheY-like chemotaxis protein